MPLAPTVSIVAGTPALGAPLRLGCRYMTLSRLHSETASLVAQEADGRKISAPKELNVFLGGKRIE
ncbi:hypothetical protein GCM10023352_02980 [Rothia endophytica]|uniref:Uncharacterized protein n=1 Tax=Rothia endophytica TaxID=1324766 RepID=A0ABP9B0F2_9MICC